MSKNKIIESLSFCVIDLETTGSLPAKDRIIDIGLVRLEGFKIVAEKNFIVNPGVRIPKFIQRLTKISQADVEHAPAVEEIIAEVIDFIGDSIIVAHNISFDIPFLNGVLERIGKGQLKNKTLCTHIMTKYLLPDVVSSNLSYLNKLFKLPEFKAHRALEDARMTAHLLQHYLDIFAQRNLAKVNHLYYPVNRFELHKKVFYKSDQPKVESFLKKITVPFYIKIKGEKGITFSTIPIYNISEEFNFISEALSRFDWSAISIQLLNSYYEGLTLLKQHRSRLPDDEKQIIDQYLSRKWTQKVPESFTNFDFIISSHLIPEQFVLHTKIATPKYSNIVYKYPNHQKKLLHQVKKISQLNSKLSQSHQSSDPFSKILLSYLAQNSENYLFFNEKNLLSQFERSWRNLPKLLKSNTFNSDKYFPLFHL